MVGGHLSICILIHPLKHRTEYDFRLVYSQSYSRTILSNDPLFQCQLLRLSVLVVKKPESGTDGDICQALVYRIEEDENDPDGMTVDAWKISENLRSRHTGTRCRHLPHYSRSQISCLLLLHLLNLQRSPGIGAM